MTRAPEFGIILQNGEGDYIMSILEKYNFILLCILYAAILAHIVGIWYLLFPHSLDWITHLFEDKYIVDDTDQAADSWGR